MVSRPMQTARVVKNFIRSFEGELSLQRKNFHSRQSAVFEVRKKNSGLLPRRSGLLEEESQDQSHDDTVKQWSKASLVVCQRKARVAFGHFDEPCSEHRTKQRAEREIKEVYDSCRRAAQFRRIRFLDNGVRQHRRAGSDSHQDSDSVTAKNFRVAEQDPGHHTQQHEGPTEDHWFTATQSIGNEAQQWTTNHPAERNGGGQCDCRFEFAAARFLEKAHTPGHSEDRGRNKEQTGNKTAEKRLWIAKDSA